MENASKALIIAGAILVSILIIGIGVILVRSGQNVANRGEQIGSNQEIETFNSQFSGLEGTQKGSTLKALKSKIIVSNSNDESHTVGVRYNGSDTAITNSLDQLKANTSYKVTVNYATANSGMTYTSGSKSLAGAANVKTETGYLYEILISDL